MRVAQLKAETTEHAVIHDVAQKTAGGLSFKSPRIASLNKALYKTYRQWRSQVLGFGGAKIPMWSSGRAEGTSFLGSPGAMLPW